MKRPTITAGVLAIALAGCGGSSQPSLSAFKSGFTADKVSFHQLGVNLQQAITTAKTETDSQLSSEIGALAVRARGESSALTKLKPPSQYKTATHQLAAAFGAVATDLGQISAAAAKHQAAAARAATLALIQDAAKVKASDDAISAKLHLPASG